MQIRARLTLASEAPSSVLTARSLLTSACRERESVTQLGASRKQAGGRTGRLQEFGGPGTQECPLPRGEPAEHPAPSTHTGSTHTGIAPYREPQPGAALLWLPGRRLPGPPSPLGSPPAWIPLEGRQPPRPHPSSEARPGQGQPRGGGGRGLYTHLIAQQHDDHVLLRVLVDLRQPGLRGQRGCVGGEHPSPCTAPREGWENLFLFDFIIFP